MFQTEIIRNEPAYRPRPADLPGYHQFSNGEFDAFVHKDNLLNTIAAWARQRNNEEIVGRLVGRPYHDDQGGWSVVTGAILACYDGGPTTVRTTVHDTAEISQTLEQDYPFLDLMGWYHSHTFPMDEYSSIDKANQAEWTKPYHLGLLVVVRANSVNIHAFRGPEAERLTESYIYQRPRSSSLNEPQLPTAAAQPTPAPYSPAPQTPLRTSLIESLFHLILWPLVFLVGTHIIADGIAQIRLPIVLQQTDDWKPVAESMDDTASVIKSLKSEFEQHTSQTEQQIRELKAYDRNQDGMDLLNWIADHLSFDDTESTSEIDLDNQ